MRPTIPLLILGALSCTSSQAAPEVPGTTTYRSYRTWDATAVNSTLVENTHQGLHTLRGHTQLPDGTWLMEQATLDDQGRLLRAEIDRGGPCAEHPTHIVVDAQHGKVEVNTAGIYTRWSVPNDLPWVPVGLIAAETSGHNLATPVAMTIALRSAKSVRATRLVDIQHFTSATIMSDQMLVNDAEPTVVLGDDYAEVEGDLPVRVHLAAFERDLEAHDPDLTAAWARLRCKNPNEGTAL
jgi:hypothetical protein